MYSQVLYAHQCCALVLLLSFMAAFGQTLNTTSVTSPLVIGREFGVLLLSISTAMFTRELEKQVGETPCMALSMICICFIACMCL